MFNLKWKLAPRFIGLYEILEKVGDAAYRLESHVLQSTEIQLEPNLSNVKKPLRVIDRKEKVHRNKHIPLIMMQWQRRCTEELTWGLEIRMCVENPEFF